jgi:peptide/nickel transport system ATP-binding protein
MPDPILRVDHLTAGFERNGRFLAAVEDVSFSLSPGETLCLVGESGSGKTVTAYELLRILDPPARFAAGEIRLDGQDLCRLDERAMQPIRGARIALVFQEPSSALNPVFTIGHQIEETLLVHGRATRQSARRQAVALLETVRVPDPERRAQQYPHQLSGGLRQRAVIALAIACEPRVLVADEPTSALDVTVQAEILDLLRSLQQRLGLALLLITHDLGVVAEMADRVAVMYAGRIVEHAPAGALFSEPKHPYTRALLASRSHGAPGTALQALAGSAPALDERPAGCAFAPRCPDRFDPCASLPATIAAGPLHTVNCHRYGSCPSSPSAAS